MQHSSLGQSRDHSPINNFSSARMYEYEKHNSIYNSINNNNSVNYNNSPKRLDFSHRREANSLEPASYNNPRTHRHESR